MYRCHGTRIFWKGCGGMCSGKELSSLGFKEGVAVMREVTSGLWAFQIQPQQCQEGTSLEVRMSLLPRAFPCGQPLCSAPKYLPFCDMVEGFGDSWSPLCACGGRGHGPSLPHSPLLCKPWLLALPPPQNSRMLVYL